VSRENAWQTISLLDTITWIKQPNEDRHYREGSPPNACKYSEPQSCCKWFSSALQKDMPAARIISEFDTARRGASFSCPWSSLWLRAVMWCEHQWAPTWVPDHLVDLEANTSVFSTLLSQDLKSVEAILLKVEAGMVNPRVRLQMPVPSDYQSPLLGFVTAGPQTHVDI
jgi:hypothetical protein